MFFRFIAIYSVGAKGIKRFTYFMKLLWESSTYRMGILACG